MKLFAFQILVLLSTTSAAAGSYVYTSHAAKESYEHGVDSMVLDPVSGIIKTRDGHGRERMRDCSTKNFHCFLSNSMLFAVAKRGLNIGDEWKTRGQTFRVERSMELKAFGHALNVWIITTQRSATRRDSFYFSSDQGLIGIKFEDADPKLDYVRFLMLESQLGYPY